MKVLLPQNLWSAYGCDDYDTRDIVTRCFYLGYGDLKIREVISKAEGERRDSTWRTIRAVSNDLGFEPGRDVVVKERKS